MNKHNTVLPKDSKEGVLLVLRHGMRMTLRDDNSGSNFQQVVRGGTIRVTSSYAELIMKEHIVHVEHLGFIPMFEEVGKENDMIINKDIEAANQLVNEFADENSELKAQLAALQAQLAEKAPADKAPAVVVEEEEEEGEEEEETPPTPDPDPAPKAEEAKAEPAVKATRSRSAK